MKDVEKLCEDLNVQLDNLCQFLPQDRVTAFAGMKPEEMLQETEKALLDSSLHTKHMQLIEMRDGIRELENVSRTLIEY